MKFIILIWVLFISACSTQIVEMTPEPTVQKYDLSDSEGDGIILARDECPDSNVGAKVDNKGCGSQTVYTIRHRLDVNFDINSYQVKDIYNAEIESLAIFMDEYPEVTVIIEGHTSVRGSAAHNLKLSENRALAIQNILINKYKISADRITAVGYGESKLLANGNDNVSHQKNRRIVAEISSDKSLIDMKWTIYSVDKEAE
ncbi:OmpA family protein [Colwellia echini]|uniref:OmpA family protein n=1 Tax=Colwellia echini TaxID=1982103 RepID=A0ABY3MZI0_9GAMM|nr:OmpA family protein [Colwellia echini]TYK66489.1 OmpA family protein [Colwellia echini]